MKITVRPNHMVRGTELRAMVAYKGTVYQYQLLVGWHDIEKNGWDMHLDYFFYQVGRFLKGAM